MRYHILKDTGAAVPVTAPKRRKAKHTVETAFKATLDISDRVTYIMNPSLKRSRRYGDFRYVKVIVGKPSFRRSLTPSIPQEPGVLWTRLV